MRELSFRTVNYLSFLLFAIFLGGIQSALWLQVFGYTPAPYLWIAIANYWIMFRTPVRAMIMSYLLAYVLYAMSGMPLAVIFFVLIVNFCVLYTLRDRVLWAGPTQFMLASGGTAFIVPFSSLLGSYFFETTRLIEFHLFSWTLSALFTALAALPIYYVLVFIDKLTQQEAPKDASSELI